MSQRLATIVALSLSLNASDEDIYKNNIILGVQDQILSAYYSYLQFNNDKRRDTNELMRLNYYNYYWRKLIKLYQYRTTKWKYSPLLLNEILLE